MGNRNDPFSRLQVILNNGKRGELQGVAEVDELIAFAKMPGYYTRAFSGKINIAPTGDYEIYEAASPVEPTRPANLGAGGALNAVSVSVLDTGAGTGAQELAIDYLDGEGHERVALATMNGIASVAAVEARQTFDPKTFELLSDLELRDPTGPPVPVIDCYRVIGASVNRAGSTGRNQGIISVDIASDVQTVMGAERNRALHTFVTVPKGQTGVVTGIGLQGGDFGSGDEIVIEARLQGDIAPKPWQTIGVIGKTDNPIVRLPTRRRAPQLAEIRFFLMKPSGSALELSAVIELIFGPNPISPDPAIENTPWLFPPRMG